MIHVIYIPGLGDKYDFVRKIGLKLWRRRNIKVTHFPMKWEDPSETFEQKLTRLEKVIDKSPVTKTLIVGESAGGAFALAALHHFEPKIAKVVTVCGMNHGANSVDKSLYMKNPSFHETMKAADMSIQNITDENRSHIYTIYSSLDYTVRPKNTLLAGVRSHDLRISGHMPTILTILFFRYNLVLE